MLRKVCAIAKVKKFFPIVIITIFAVFVLIGLVSLSVALKHRYSPLVTDAVIIIVLSLALVGYFAWIFFDRGLPLTRVQNIVAGRFITPASWIPPIILVNIPETEWPIVAGLGSCFVLLVWLAFTYIHRRIFHSRIAGNIAISAGIEDINHPEIRRLSNNSILPNAVIYGAAVPSISIAAALSVWPLTEFLGDHTIVAMAGGISLMVGLLFYNFSPRQIDIYDFIKDSQAK